MHEQKPYNDPWGKELLTPGEVGKILGVNPRTVTRWGSKRILTVVRTPGGHTRFMSSEVSALLNQSRTRAIPQSGSPKQPDRRP